MLRTTIRNTKIGTEYAPLYPDSIAYTDDTKEKIVFSSQGNNLSNGDFLRFFRTTDTANLYANKTVLSVSGDTFTIEAFPDIMLSYSNIKIENVATGFDSDLNVVYRSALVIYFDSTPHEFLSNLSFSYITKEVYNGYYTFFDDAAEKKCVGDNVLFNGFVYKIGEGGINEDGKYVFSNNPYESLDSHYVTIYFYNETDGENHYISDGFVLINPDGLEDRTRLVFFINDDAERYSNANYLVNNPYGLMIYSQDKRFLVEGEDNELSFVTDNADIQVSFLYKNVSMMSFKIPLENNISKTFLRDEALSEVFLKGLEDDNLNPIVDFEKCPFIPRKYYGDDFSNIDDIYFNSVKEVVFNLHFRERVNTDTGEWVTDDTLGWNNYTIYTSGDTTSLLAKRGLEVTDADVLSYAGFTDGDVYFQRNNLKKSFIRLSFYDTPNRRDQSLLFYSTMFYDTGEAFLKYVKARSSADESGYYGILGDETTYTSNEYTDGDKDNRLCMRFIAHDNLDMQHSSEGFYTYFYPSMLNGTLVSEAYMKVEFNHAKYGRVIPFVMPHTEGSDGRLIPIETDSDNFPLHYMSLNDDGDYTNVDWDRLNNDMYIKVFLKYDDLSNKHVWFLPMQPQSYEDDGQIVLNLFEPRINSYETVSSQVIPEAPSFDGNNIKIIIKFIHSGITLGTIYPTRFAMTLDGVEIYHTSVNSDKTIILERAIDNDMTSWGFTFYNTSPIIYETIEQGGGLPIDTNSNARYISVSCDGAGSVELPICTNSKCKAWGFAMCSFEESLSKMVVPTVESGVTTNNVTINITISDNV